MAQILLLLKYELRVVRRWFYTQTVSKLIIALAFLLLALTVSAVIFLFSRAFFHRLTAYEIYGELSGQYIVRAAIVIIAWFAIASAIVSTFSWFTQSHKETEYLLTQPIASFVTPWSLFIKTNMINIILLFFIFTPLTFAYMAGFYGRIPFSFIGRYIFVLILFSTLVNSLASIIGYCLSMIIGRKKTTVTILGLTIFISGMFVLINFIFPKTALMRLYDASPGEFMNLYKQLPLSSAWWPTTWIADTLITGAGWVTIYFTMLTMIFLFLSLAIQNRYFSTIFYHLNFSAYPILKPKNIVVSNWFYRAPLIYKNFLSLTRVSSEFGYSLFLLSVAVFFFGFLSQALSVRSPHNLWQNETVIFAFVWLAFFVTAYLLRLIFPLMAREGQSAWYLFTLPLVKSQIIFSQLILAIITTVPFMIFSIIIWNILSFTPDSRLFIIFASLIIIILLSIVNVLLGSISPNFFQANDPEKVSTSGMGIVTLVISFLIIAIFSYFIWKVLNQKLSSELALTELTILSLLIASTCYFLTIRTKTYQF